MPYDSYGRGMPPGGFRRRLDQIPPSTGVGTPAGGNRNSTYFDALDGQGDHAPGAGVYQRGGVGTPYTPMGGRPGQLRPGPLGLPRPLPFHPPSYIPGDLPPQSGQNVPPTGGPLPPQQVPTAPPTGGNLPPQQVPGPGVPAPNGNTGIVPPGTPATPGTNSGFSPADAVNQTLEQFLNGPYAENARRRGAEMAAQRGLMNSGMAAGNSERAAMEAVQPFVQQAMGLLSQREQNAFTGEQSERERQLRTKLQSDASFQQDWLNGRNFNRDFYQQMSMIPMNSAAQLSAIMAQYALENPDVYTPNNMAGFQEFFNQNLQQIMAQYFGGAPSTTPPATGTGG